MITYTKYTGRRQNDFNAPAQVRRKAVRVYGSPSAALRDKLEANLPRDGAVAVGAGSFAYLSHFAGFSKEAEEVGWHVQPQASMSLSTDFNINALGNSGARMYLLSTFRLKSALYDNHNRPRLGTCSSRCRRASSRPSAP